jgi:ATP-dependent DNA ligase
MASRIRSHARLLQPQRCYAFDPLELDGRDLRNEPWARRRALLVQLLTGADEGIRRWIKIKNLAHPDIERAMLIALSKRGDPRSW